MATSVPVGSPWVVDRGGRLCAAAAPDLVDPGSVALAVRGYREVVGVMAMSVPVGLV